jgi:hypothetical protein
VAEEEEAEQEEAEEEEEEQQEEQEEQEEAAPLTLPWRCRICAQALSRAAAAAPRKYTDEGGKCFSGVWQVPANASGSAEYWYVHARRCHLKLV